MKAKIELTEAGTAQALALYYENKGFQVKKVHLKVKKEFPDRQTDSYPKFDKTIIEIEV